jgi:hypothetical protein
MYNTITRKIGVGKASARFQVSFALGNLDTICWDSDYYRYVMCIENYLSLIFRKINDFVHRFILDNKSVDFTILVVNFTIINC